MDFDIEEGVIIEQGDSIIKIYSIILGKYFIGIDFSSRHQVYSLVRGRIETYIEEYNYEISEEFCGEFSYSEAFSKFLEDELI